MMEPLPWYSEYDRYGQDLNTSLYLDDDNVGTGAEHINIYIFHKSPVYNMHYKYSGGIIHPILN